MEKWEYLILRIGWVGLGADQPRARAVNGNEFQNWKGRELHDALNQLGEQGWELVSPLTQAYGATIGLVLKRPKA